MAAKKKASSKNKTTLKPAKNMAEMMKNTRSRGAKNPMLTTRSTRKPCRQCAQNKAEDTVMDIIGLGAKAAIGVGVLGAIGNTFQDMNN